MAVLPVIAIAVKGASTCQKAMAIILSRTSATYARLQFNAGPGGSLELPIVADWQAWPRCLANSSLDTHVMQWLEEYERCVHPMPFHYPELLPKEPTEVLSDIIHPDQLSWSDLLEYAYP